MVTQTASGRLAKRPAIIVPSLGRGGGERVALDLARGLRSEGMSPLLVVLGGGDWLSQARSGLDVRSGLWDSGRDHRVVGRLSTLLEAEGVTTAIVFGRDACGFWGRIACSRVGVPIVQSLHMGSFGLLTHPKRVASHWANRVLDAGTTAFVCVSADQARFVTSIGLPSHRVLVIPNGVETPAAGPANDDRSQA
ncbi:MAG TPA: glycosyltransferase family 4 protein, partial [Candidatus Limnocylindrales bacterium]